MSQPYLPSRLLALEEHYVAPSLEEELNSTSPLSIQPHILPKLQDTAAGRLNAMDEGHLSFAVLCQSYATGESSIEACQSANDHSASIIAKNPTRYSAFAVLPMSNPTAAADELERSVRQLHLPGAMIWSHLIDGTYYDSPSFEPLFAMAEKLDVPIYIHPTGPTDTVFRSLYDGNYNQTSALRLSTTAFGWHIDTGICVLRLYAAGTFARFPKLKIIIGHSGEDLPMFLDRIDMMGLRTDDTFNRVWDTNIWVTTSAWFTVRMFKMLKEVTQMERILYSVDYPFVSFTQGWNFIQELAASGTLTNEEMDAFAYGNAERLLKLKS